MVASLLHLASQEYAILFFSTSYCVPSKEHLSVEVVSTESFLSSPICEGERVTTRLPMQYIMCWLGEWARNFAEGQALERIQLKYTTHQVHREHIRFFNTHKEYSIQL